MTTVQQVAQIKWIRVQVIIDNEGLSLCVPWALCFAYVRSDSTRSSPTGKMRNQGMAGCHNMKCAWQRRRENMGSTAEWWIACAHHREKLHEWINSLWLFIHRCGNELPRHTNTAYSLFLTWGHQWGASSTVVRLHGAVRSWSKASCGDPYLTVSRWAS